MAGSACARPSSRAPSARIGAEITSWYCRVFSLGARASDRRLHHQRREAPGDAAHQQHHVADPLARIGRRRRHAEGQHEPANDISRPSPLRPAEAIARHQEMRADHHHERCDIDEQRGAARGGVNEAAIDEDEFDARTGCPRRCRLSACRRASRARCRARAQSQMISAPRSRSQCRLNERRNVGQRELHRDLIEAPAQAQEHDQRAQPRSSGRVAEVCGAWWWLSLRVPGREGAMVVASYTSAAKGCTLRHPSHARRVSRRQFAQMPVISITGAFGVKPRARVADFSDCRHRCEGASPTSPQRSQIRNTTRSSEAWRCTQAMKALRLSMRCASPFSIRKSSAR